MNRFATLAALTGALVLAGCSTPARMEQMQVESSLGDRAAFQNSILRSQIAMKDVTGGKETNPMWISNVSSEEFARALEASLRGAGLLADNRQGSKYLLTAHLLKLDQPLMGASMTVTATVQYTLVERATGKDVFSRTLVTPFTAAWNAAFLGAERLKLANEGSIRANIGALIEALKGVQVSQLSLQGS
ncbi:hypothetical protein [Rubrivivax sp. JA1026]|uniref:hypothetical protein n=1 Tax=Rubrivivax sp. JA1026 TaxID=2710888 RepID=UPI0013E902D6|nr:hypothetical protein [Rubrivivax sp. JA1026]